MLLHEVEAKGPDAGASRTYLFENNDDVTPIGQRDGAGGWVHYVADVNGAPDELVDAAGNLVGKLSRETFGAASSAPGSPETSPFRAPGQIVDDETGLHYNRYRYYDPETGHYISPDPLGPMGGTNLYMYGPNPVGWYDPLGWQHCAIAAAAGPPPDYNPIPLPNGPQYNAGPTPGYPNGQDPRNHTERQILRDLAGTGQANGATVNISGQLPPCPQCHRAMQAFAQNHGTTIKYTYNGNTVTYAPGQAPAGTPGAANTLVGAYGMHPNPNAVNTASEGMPVPNNGYPYSYNNYAGAWGAYTAQRNPIQQQPGGMPPPPAPAAPPGP